MRKLPINKKTRFRIYRQALRKLKTKKGYADTSGFCLLFSLLAMDLVDYNRDNLELYYNITNYPEIMKYLPENRCWDPTLGYWFPNLTTDEGRKIRIQILEEILKK